MSKLEKKIYLVKKKSKPEFGLEAFDLNVRGNYWSYSDVEVKAKDYIEIEKEEKIEEEESQWILVVLAVVTGLLLLSVLILVYYLCSVQKHQKLSFNTSIHSNLINEETGEIEYDSLRNSLVMED